VLLLAGAAALHDRISAAGGSRAALRAIVIPTAAALLAELAEDCGPIPPMQLTAVGYGAGTRLTVELPCGSS
jgi:uncharacterized protein (DUF111 family)